MSESLLSQAVGDGPAVPADAFPLLDLLAELAEGVLRQANVGGYGRLHGYRR
jgi:hypothetical protein